MMSDTIIQNGVMEEIGSKIYNVNIYQLLTLF